MCSSKATGLLDEHQEGSRNRGGAVVETRTVAQEDAPRTCEDPRDRSMFGSIYLNTTKLRVSATENFSLEW